VTAETRLCSPEQSRIFSKRRDWATSPRDAPIVDYCLAVNDLAASFSKLRKCRAVAANDRHAYRFCQMVTSRFSATPASTPKKTTPRLIATITSCRQLADTSRKNSENGGRDYRRFFCCVISFSGAHGYGCSRLHLTKVAWRI